MKTLHLTFLQQTAKENYKNQSNFTKTTGKHLSSLFFKRTPIHSIKYLLNK